MSVVNGPRKRSGVVQNAVWNTLTNYISMSNSVLDLKGSYNGTLVGGASYVDDSVSFDGVNDGITLLNSQTIPTSDFSFNIWYYGNTNVLQIFMDFSDGVSNSWLSTWPVFGIQGVRANDIEGHVFISSGVTYPSWHMVTITYKIGGNTVFYFDAGEPQIPTSIARTYRPCPIALGFSQTLGGYYFNGKLKQYSFFNSELTASDVLTLYNSGSGLPYIP